MNTDVTPHKPASYTTSWYNIISVGASTQYDYISSFSNYGATTVDIFAPGDAILTCYPTAMCSSHGSLSAHKATGYHVDSGTSFAAPYVTGTVALMFIANPNLATNDVKDCINITADQSTVFYNKCVSGGRLNAYAAVQEAIARDYT